jgi:biotin transport system substrate-specific component
MSTPTIETQAAGRQLSWQQSWALATLMTGVTVLSARFSEYIPPTPVPITLQVFAVLLTGLLLGRRWSAVAQVQYLLLGAVGAPVFAKGGLGLPTLFGLTGGYLLSYPIAATIVGWIAGRAGDERATLPRQALACAVGLVVIYGMGCAWYAAYAHASLLSVVLPGALIFLGWDCVKAAAAIVVARGSVAARSRAQR